MTPFEMLTILDDAIARAPRGRRAIALELRSRPTVLGQSGHYLHTEDVEGTQIAVYGFTKRQCQAMRAVIVEAARQDATSPGDADA